MPAILASERRGVIIPLVAALMVVLFGFIAFSVDIGYIAKSRQELQTAADAAALAGANQLLNRSALQGSYSTTATIAAVQTSAQQYAAQNASAGVSVQLNANSANDAGGDIVCGTIANPRDPSGTFVASASPVFNAVQITAHRNSQTNGSLRLFFANMLGTTFADLSATATAVNDQNIQGFKIGASGAQTSKLLPFALDVDTWSQVVAGSGPDAYTYVPATQSVGSGSDGITEVNLYPYNKLTAGNFGTVNLGQSNNGTSILDRQILNGPNASDLAGLGGQVALGSDGTLDLVGNPGISAGMSSSLQSIIGQPRIILLYQSPVQGNGANAQYTIVGFAGVIIADVQLKGGNKSVTIQPEIVQDPTAYGGGPTTSSRYVYTSTQLAR